jgi:hypothetical protein
LRCAPAFYSLAGRLKKGSSNDVIQELAVKPLETNFTTRAKETAAASWDNIPTLP